MKAHKPDTDQEAEYVVFADGIQCTEYVLPSATSDNPNIVECFVEIKPGSELTFHGRLAGSILHGAVDYVVDGTFVAESRCEAASRVKYTRLSRKITKALNCPYPPGWTSAQPPSKMEEGGMMVKQLGSSALAELSRQEVGDEQATRTGVGSIAIVVSVNQDILHNYDNGDRDLQIYFGAWRDRDQARVRKGGILPDTYVELEVTGGPVQPKRSVKHRHHWIETRPGVKAWATFIFHYRTKETLEAAGCIQRSQKAQELEPWDDLMDGDFIFADKHERTKASRAKKAGSAAEVGNDERGEDARNSKDTAGNPMFLSPPPNASPKAAKKKGRLGGTLKLQKDDEGGVEAIVGGAKTEMLPAQSTPGNAGRPQSPGPEQTQADISNSLSEKLLDANDHLFDDDDSLFMPASEDADHMNSLTADNEHLSSIARQDNESFNAEMGAALSFSQRLSPVTTPEANDGDHDSSVQSFHDEAGDYSPASHTADMPTSMGFTNGFSTAHANNQNASQSPQTPHAATENQSPYYGRTKSGYASTSPTSSPTFAITGPDFRAKPTSNDLGEEMFTSSEAAVKNRPEERKQAHRIEVSRLTHARAEVAPSPFRDAVASSPSMQQPNSDLDRMPSIADIRAAIPPEGSELGYLANLFNSRGPFTNPVKAKQAFNKRVDEIATFSNSCNRFYLHVAAQPAHTESSTSKPPIAKPPRRQYPVAMPPEQPQAIKQELVEEESGHNMTPVAENRTAAPSPFQPTTTARFATGPTVATPPNDRVTNPGHKRSSSAMSPAASSRGSPAKRGRLDELAERKAKALRNVEMKNARNAAKRKEIENRNAAREAAMREQEAALREQEEQEMREIEELERMEAEADEEFGELEAMDMDMDADNDDGGDGY